MDIIYTQNPIRSEIHLNATDIILLWHKIKIQEMEHLLQEAHFHLSDEFLDLTQGRRAVDPDYYSAESHSQKTPLDLRCDHLLSIYLDELKGAHYGDCIAVAGSCGKCMAEQILGIDTIPGVSKMVLATIGKAFKNTQNGTLNEAVAWLQDHDPTPTGNALVMWQKHGGYEQHLERWKKEIHQAIQWLLQYQKEHLVNPQYED